MFSQGKDERSDMHLGDACQIMPKTTHEKCIEIVDLKNDQMDFDTLQSADQTQSESNWSPPVETVQELNPRLQIVNDASKFLPRVDIQFTSEEMDQHREWPCPTSSDVQQPKKEEGGNPSNQRQLHALLTPQERLDIIYMYEIHKTPLCQVAQELNINYSTIRTLASGYRRSGGRINKLLTYMTKKRILQQRQSEMRKIVMERARKRRLNQLYKKEKGSAKNAFATQSQPISQVPPFVIEESNEPAPPKYCSLNLFVHEKKQMETTDVLNKMGTFVGDRERYPFTLPPR